MNIKFVPLSFMFFDIFILFRQTFSELRMKFPHKHMYTSMLDIPQWWPILTQLILVKRFQFTSHVSHFMKIGPKVEFLKAESQRGS
jgi:hypothetical protein